MPRFAKDFMGAMVEIPPGIPFKLGDVAFGADVLYGWTEEDAVAQGLKVITPAEPPPPGFRQGATQLVDRGSWVEELADVEPIPLADIAAELQDAVRAKRWRVEIGGTTVNQVLVSTDEKAQAKVTGLIALFERDPEMETSDFEAQPGWWISINQAEAVSIGVSIGRHVQACFTRSRQLSEAIAAALAAEDRAALVAIDIEAGWPS